MRVKTLCALLMVFAISGTALAQMPAAVKSTFDKLYPGPKSSSNSELTSELEGVENFYNVGYYQQSTGDNLNILITASGKHILTLPDERTKVEDATKKSLIEALKLECSSPLIYVEESPEGEKLYYAKCYYNDGKSEKTRIVIANADMKALYAGSWSYTF
jgi:hypothetical protein